MSGKDSPGVLQTFFSKIGTIKDPELKELITALRFIQLDRSLTTADATSKITAAMIENINRIQDKDIATADPLDKTSVGMTEEEIKKMNGDHQFNYIKYTAKSKKYEYIKLDVEIRDGLYSLSVDVKDAGGSLSNNFNSVHNFLVKERLRELVDEKVFKLFSTPVKDIDSLSNPKNNKAFQHLKFEADDHLYNKSLIDIILDLEKYVRLTTLSNSGNEKTTDKYKLFKSIYEFMKRTEGATISDENSLIMDIVKFQNRIDQSKENIKEERNKIYTYLARDKNYTKTLKTKRAMLYLSIAAFVLISMLYGGILYNKNMSNADKSTIVLVVASLILFTNLILYGTRFIFQSKETFVNDDSLSTYGFTNDATSAGTINVNTIMEKFFIRYAELLSKDIKNEYYDALYVSQEKDKKLLDKLEKEHSLKSHFHQLKNNLTHFKINETKEYSKISQLAIVLISLLAILYLGVLQDTIDMKIFKIVSGLTFVVFVTYVLLIIKSIMLRDKYDWDRFHWTVKNVQSNMNPQQCPLPGFPN